MVSHPMFKRERANLNLNAKIDLVNALAGFVSEVEHVDGRKVRRLLPAGCCTACTTCALEAMPWSAQTAHGIDQFAIIDGKGADWEIAMQLRSARDRSSSDNCRCSMQVKLQRDTVTPHGFVERLRGEGMPRQGNAATKGDLIVTYAVQFPESLTDAQRAGVRALFSA